MAILVFPYAWQIGESFLQKKVDYFFCVCKVSVSTSRYMLHPNTKIHPFSLMADVPRVQKRSWQALHCNNTASIKCREKYKVAKIFSLPNDHLPGTNTYLQFDKNLLIT